MTLPQNLTLFQNQPQPINKRLRIIQWWKKLELNNCRKIAQRIEAWRFFRRKERNIRLMQLTAQGRQGYCVLLTYVIDCIYRNESRPSATVFLYSGKSVQTNEVKDFVAKSVK